MIDTQKIIGSEEWCCLPDLSIPAIKVHFNINDTYSCLRAINIQIHKRDNETWAKFTVHPLQHNLSTKLICESKVISEVNLNGSKHYLIETTISLNDQQRNIKVALVNNAGHDFRLTLNKDILENILIDPNKTCLLGKKTPTEIKSIYSNNTTTKSALKIGILATNSQLYSAQRLVEVAQQRGHSIEFLNIDHCHFEMSTGSSQIHHLNKPLDHLDAIIPRDKLMSLQVMLKNGLPIPTSAFSQASFNNKQVMNVVGGAPLILKLISGTQGQGVVLADSTKSAESVMESFRSLNTPFLVQKFIKESNGHDIRAFVIDGKVVAAMERIAAPGEFRANVHKGAHVRSLWF